MSRISGHSVEEAPEASRELQRNVIQFSPTGRPLNMHAQMAHSPAVLRGRGQRGQSRGCRPSDVGPRSGACPVPERCHRFLLEL